MDIHTLSICTLSIAYHSGCGGAKKKRFILIGWFTSPLRRTAFFFYFYFLINFLFFFFSVEREKCHCECLFFPNCVVDLAENRNRAHDQDREWVRVRLLTNLSADRHRQEKGIKHLRLNSPFGHSLLLFIAFPFPLIFLIWFCTFDWYYYSFTDWIPPSFFPCWKSSPNCSETNESVSLKWQMYSPDLHLAAYSQTFW